ncbi:DNA sulfur modification protein DndD [Tumebacillus sp. DT12]|uniref:Nuclease SbcCD subunit C n=1 Tax=Tumebacillus lacus TaxID=2995335 RepID=A0ABT3WWY5_9BACL|nr:DNA sulfur modification protein DndD [Tumebacillus lacus]MCX7569193.1 DNA sulfur modification protein DndD [Tumebacillus lacus]
MKFTRLRLTNIGAFYGSYDFNLTTKYQDKNVVLFGGQNGSGKTTILEGFRLALFGPLSFGYKTDTSSYYEKIDAKLNTIAKKNQERNYQIMLDIELVENFQRVQYTIKRSWDRSKKSIRENLNIQKNGAFMSEKEMEIFQTKLREETPPQLFEFCLFDGERITQIISDETLPAYLKDTAKVMFNLDLFENLETDINSLLRQDSIYGSLTTEEKQLHEVGQTLEDLRQRQKGLLDKQVTLEVETEDKKALLTDLSKQFEVHGGLVKEKRDALLSEMSHLEKQRGAMMERTKDAITSILPFVLVRGLVEKTAEQLKSESVLDVRNNVQNMISAHDVQGLLESLKITTQDSKESASEQIYRGILDLLSSDTSDMFHHASSQQRAEVESLLEQVKKFSKNEILDNYKKNAEMLTTVQKIRKQIDENDSATDLKKLMDTMHDLRNEIESMQLTMEQHQITLGDLTEEITQKEHEYDALKQKIVRAKKAENVFAISNRVLDVSRAFRDIQLKKKLQQVEWETTKMLQALFRKELFIYKISLDPETFHLKLYNSSNEEINKHVLSAGEKQILLLATVWAMVKCSHKRIPFVFDTLLGRLDQSHRKSLIKHLIPQCGDQVIILSTDSEINEELYKEIYPTVAKSYTIDFNTKKSTVEVGHHYFMFDPREVTAQ